MTPYPGSDPEKSPAWLALLLLLTAIIYWPGLQGSMIFDDRPNIVTNDWVHITSLNGASIKQLLFSGSSSALGRPLSMLSFGLNHLMHGLAPYPYKLTNLIIHLLNGILVFWIVTGLLRTPALKRHDTYNPFFQWLPLMVTAAWLLHPINVSTVLYVVQRMAELASLFTFLGIALYIQLRLAFNAVPASSRSKYAAAILLTTIVASILGILSKETSALLPVYLLLIEIIFFRFQLPTQAWKTRFIAGYTVIVGIPALLILYILLFRFELISSAYQYRDFTLEQRLLTQPRVIGFYLKLLLLPSLDEYSLHHDTFTVSSNWNIPVETAIWSAGLSITLLTSLIYIKKHPLFSFGLLFFIASHSIESSLIGLEMVYEHRNYPGSFGVMLALFSVVPSLTGKNASRLILYAPSILFVFILSLTTYARANIWADPVLHAITMQQNHPASPRSALEAARIMAKLHRLDPVKHANLLPVAQEMIQRAKHHDPDNPSVLAAEILLHWFAKEPVSGELIKQLATALKKHSYRSSTPSIFNALTSCARTEHCPIQPDEMLQLFQAALANPNLQDKQRAHFFALASRYAMTVLGDLKNGIEYQKIALVYAPDEPRHWLNLIRIYLGSKDRENAQAIMHSFQQRSISKTSPVIIKELKAAIAAM